MTSWRALVVAHVGGWLTLGLARAASLRLIVPEEAWPHLATLKIGGSVLGLAASSLLLVLYRRQLRPLPASGSKSRLVWRATVALGPLVAAAGWFLADGFLLRPLLTPTSQGIEWERLPFAMVSHGLLLYSWTAIYLALRFSRDAERQARQALEAEAAAQRAQLLALHYQLNPHFLFNALNAVRGLTVSAPERGREVIGRLAAFLRYALDTDPNELVTMSDELDALEHFAAIDKARFEEQVRYDFSVDPEVMGVRVPPLFMIPLVENATQHGDANLEGIVEVRVRAERHRGGMRVTISNSGRLGSGSGLGLPNVDERMGHVFPGHYQRRIFQRGDEVVTELEVDSEGLP
ncbi:MAG: histidine kinase [Myxococcota bacterium]